MALFTRLSSTGDDRISIHAFNAGVRLWAVGSAFVTRTRIIDAFTLVGDEVADLDALAAVYAGKSSQGDKSDYLMRIEDADILVETGFYNEAQWKAELEI